MRKCSIYSDFQAPDLDWLREIPAIEVLRRIWVQNSLVEDGQLRWREVGNLPPATLFITSPYDPEAHRGKKRSTWWTGYKVHLTETCEEALPHLIPHVATTPAPKTDEAMTERIQKAGTSFIERKQTFYIPHITGLCKQGTDFLR